MFPGALLLALAACVLPATARAQEGRYALLIGANRGGPEDRPLRFAQTDAQRTREVLTTLGGFAPDNVVVLEDPDADRVRRALARMNARLRAETAPGQSSVLFVFYSGHGDALALQLGATPLPWHELRDSVAGSAAQTRVLVIDACRSGQATQVKGTQLDQPFALPSTQEAPEGFVVLSSAAAGESAQESDDLGASFFTHHFLSGLSGAADLDGDGAVTLTEVYRHSAERTIASTARTLAGVQHPTYRYELRGRADLVVTRLARNSRLGSVRLGAPGHYLLRNDRDRLVAEATVDREPRVLQLRAGTYAIQRRVPDRLLESTLALSEGATVDAGSLRYRSVTYDQLVRKGGDRVAATRLALWIGATTPWTDGFSPPARMALAWSRELPTLSFDAAIATSYAAESTGAVGTRLVEGELLAGGRRVVDFGRLSLAPGLRVGAAVLHARYDTARIAPSRTTLVPFVDALVEATTRVGDRWAIALELVLRSGWLHEQTGIDRTTARVTARAAVAVGLARFW